MRRSKKILMVIVALAATFLFSPVFIQDVYADDETIAEHWVVGEENEYTCQDIIVDVDVYNKRWSEGRDPGGVEYGFAYLGGSRNALYITGTPQNSGTFTLELYYDDGSEVVYYTLTFTVDPRPTPTPTPTPRTRPRDDDDDSPKPQSEPSWTPAKAAATIAAQKAQKQQAAATQLASIQTMLRTKTSDRAGTGRNVIDLDMTKVDILDPATVNLLLLNNRFAFNVKISVPGGLTTTIMIPANFNFRPFIKADGTMNIHEVLWWIISKKK